MKSMFCMACCSLGAAAVAAQAGSPTDCIATAPNEALPVVAAGRKLERGDINGDGADELLLPLAGDIFVRWGAPFGQGELAVLIDEFFYDYTSAVIGDANGDGLKDVFACSNEVSKLFIQQSNGSFVSSRSFPAALEASFGDVNADGLVDILTRFAFVSAPDILHISRKSPESSGYVVDTYVLDEVLVDTVLGDLNGDGYDDIALGGEVYFPKESVYGIFGYMLNDGTGKFGEPQWVPGWESPFALTLADVDLDGDMDGAMSFHTFGSFPFVALFLNDGLANFTVRSFNLPAPGGLVGTGHDFADIDADGILDMVAAKEFTMNSFHATGPAMFESWQGWSAPGMPNHFYPRLGDYNGDGAIDLAVVREFSNDTDIALFAGSCAGCPADLNGDSSVNVFDLLDVLAAWGPCDACSSDMNHDGDVNVFDLLDLLGAWGSCS